MEVVLWGTGTPRREFLYIDDMVDACVLLMNLPDNVFNSLLGTQHSNSPPLINIGCGKDQTIRELAELVKEVVGYGGKIVWDTSKPDGTPRKLLDVSRLTRLGWSAKIDLGIGIKRAYEDFLRNAKDGLEGSL